MSLINQNVRRTVEEVLRAAQVPGMVLAVARGAVVAAGRRAVGGAVARGVRGAADQRALRLSADPRRPRRRADTGPSRVAGSRPAAWRVGAGRRRDAGAVRHGRRHPDRHPGAGLTLPRTCCVGLVAARVLHRTRPVASCGDVAGRRSRRDAGLAARRIRGAHRRRVVARARRPRADPRVPGSQRQRAFVCVDPDCRPARGAGRRHRCRAALRRTHRARRHAPPVLAHRERRRLRQRRR